MSTGRKKCSCFVDINIGEIAENSFRVVVVVFSSSTATPRPNQLNIDIVTWIRWRKKSQQNNQSINGSSLGPSRGRGTAGFLGPGQHALPTSASQVRQQIRYSSVLYVLYDNDDDDNEQLPDIFSCSFLSIRHRRACRLSRSAVNLHMSLRHSPSSTSPTRSNHSARQAMTTPTTITVRTTTTTSSCLAAEAKAAAVIVAKGCRFALDRQHRLSLASPCSGL